MSPVFRHGGLRLYLLKLLDEAPRHGYDVIRLLQDKFLGVYSPSPGTIYPRLARLEEEGLVTHEVVDGKKVYKITDAGRDELNRRLDDLADLEEELSASVRDIAREISRDVRETVRSLRDELTWAVREAGREARPRARAGESAAAQGAATGETGEEAGQAQDRTAAGGDENAGRDERQRRRPAGDWRDWADWTDRREWREWADRADRGEWREWARRAKQHNWSDWAGWAGWQDRPGQDKPGQDKPGQDRPGGQPRDHARSESDADLAADLERLAAAFAREIRAAARHAETVSEEAVGTLSRILTDTLSRIRSEVFRPPADD